MHVICFIFKCLTPNTAPEKGKQFYGKFSFLISPGKHAPVKQFREETTIQLHQNYPLRWMGTLSGEATPILPFLPPILLGVNFQRSFSHRSKFLPFNADPILAAKNCPQKQTGNHENYLPL